MKTLFTIILAATISIVNAQQFEFEMSNALPNLSNPALTGTSESLRLNYGNQFNGPTTLGYNFNYLSADMPIKKLHGGIGIQFQNLSILDNRINETTFQLSYSFHQKLGKNWNLALGASSGIEREHIDYEKMTFGDYPTNVDLDPNPVEFFVPINAGLTVYSGHWIFGFNTVTNSDIVISHLSNESFRTLKHRAQIGYRLTPFANKLINFTSFVSYSNENNFQQLKIQSTFNTKHFSIGGAISNGDAIAVHAGVYLKRFELKYQYSKYVSSLINYTGYTNSLALQYTLPEFKNRTTSPLNFQLF